MVFSGWIHRNGSQNTLSLTVRTKLEEGLAILERILSCISRQTAKPNLNSSYGY